jgi:hypothetical protein
LALARAGKSAEAAKSASELCELCPNAPDLLLNAARCYAICASTAKPEEKRVFIDKALGTLQKSVAAKWRDARAIESDPELAILREEAGLQSAVKAIEKD